MTSVVSKVLQEISKSFNTSLIHLGGRKRQSQEGVSCPFSVGDITDYRAEVKDLIWTDTNESLDLLSWVGMAEEQEVEHNSTNRKRNVIGGFQEIQRGKTPVCL